MEENCREELAIVTAKLIKNLSDLEEVNSTDSPIRCRDISLAITNLEDCILRLNKVLNQ